MLPVPLRALPVSMTLLQAVARQCTTLVMPVKHALGCWRPADLSANVQPMLATPGHGSFPAGHAVQAHAAAAVLKALWAHLLEKADAQRLGSLAERIADRVGQNRVVAGVHFKLDVVAGKKLGQAIGNWIVSMAQLDRSPLKKQDASVAPPPLTASISAAAIAEWKSASRG